MANPIMGLNREFLKGTHLSSQEREDLQQILRNILTKDRVDNIKWVKSKPGEYMVKEVYNPINQNHSPSNLEISIHIYWDKSYLKMHVYSNGQQYKMGF